MGIDFSFSFLPSNIFFASLVVFIGIGVYLYSFSYMRNFDSHSKNTYYISLSLFSLAMLGLILTEHLLLLFVFWELTSVCSFFLIGLKNLKDDVRKKAKWALYTTAGGGLFLLVGILLLSQIGLDHGLSIEKSYSIQQLVLINNISSHVYFKLSVLCIFLGIASKSALFPFSFWLPLAMAGPTPVSSFLHSATMVKAGLILAYKLLPLLQTDEFWNGFLISIGSITAILAAFQCLLQRNLKTMLAYSTTCVLGLLTILLGLNEINPIATFTIFVLAHALYKAALFQIVGYLDTCFHTMDFDELKQYRIHNPLAFITVLLSTLSMVGMPLTLGFYAKEFMYLSAVKSNYAYIVVPVFLFANLAMGVQAINFLKVFWPKKNCLPQGSQNNILLILPAFIYASVSSILAFFPQLTKLDTLVNLTLSSHLNLNPGIHLKLWHGFQYPYNFVLVLSVFTIAGSFLGSKFISHKLIQINTWSVKYHDFSLWPFFQHLLEQILNLFKKIIHWLQDGNLRKYIIITLLSFCGLVSLGLINVKSFQWPQINILSFEFLSLFLALLGLIAANLTKIHYRALVNLALSGVFLVTYFILHSAIDVSMTQLMVESLSLFFIFFLIRAIGLREVIKFKPWLNMIIASLFGFAIWMLFILRIPNFTRDAGNYFKVNSKLLAKGENIVNVILVDFRALDTFGEVIVVSIAIVGVGAILTRKKVNSK